MKAAKEYLVVTRPKPGTAPAIADIVAIFDNWEAYYEFRDEFAHGDGSPLHMTVVHVEQKTLKEPTQ